MHARGSSRASTWTTRPPSQECNARCCSRNKAHCMVYRARPPTSGSSPIGSSFRDFRRNLSGSHITLACPGSVAFLSYSATACQTEASSKVVRQRVSPKISMSCLPTRSQVPKPLALWLVQRCAGPRDRFEAHRSSANRPANYPASQLASQIFRHLPTAWPRRVVPATRSIAAAAAVEVVSQAQEMTWVVRPDLRNSDEWCVGGEGNGAEFFDESNEHVEIDCD